MFMSKENSFGNQKIKILNIKEKKENTGEHIYNLEKKILTFQDSPENHHPKQKERFDDIKIETSKF